MPWNKAPETKNSILLPEINIKSPLNRPHGFRATLGGIFLNQRILPNCQKTSPQSVILAGVFCCNLH
jgi:hypothetical protein